MKSKSTIIVVVGLLFAFVMYFLLKPRKEEGQTLINDGIKVQGAGNVNMSGCVSPPSSYTRWKNNDTNAWTETHWGLKIGMGYSKEQADDAINSAMGFFKAIDVKPNRVHVAHFKDDMEDWLENGGAPHWEVDKGMFRC